MRSIPRLFALIALAALAAACESSSPSADGRGACLDRPGLQKAPDGRLPCELLPPGR